eukprot:9419090-Heterocapsa_arctica.AAC.1
MQHDVDKSELGNFKHRALYTSEWGSFEHIILWSIYQTNIEIYCYIMNMQTIDGAEFISDKECIILLYCNNNKWGDAGNHYDLMHPM